MKNNRLSLLFGCLAYGIGVAVGLFLILIAVWGDIEASAYDFPRLANAGLGGLYCPILMTSEETGTISLRVSNSTANRITPSIKTQISTHLLPEQFLDTIELAPGQSERLEWSVDAKNIDLGYFILAKVLFFSAYPLPAREATCGMLVFDLPGTGRVIVPVLMTLSLIAMGWGLHRLNSFHASDEQVKRSRSSMIFLALLVSLGLLLSLLGGWISSLLVLVVSLLLLIILLGSLLSDRSR